MHFNCFFSVFSGKEGLVVEIPKTIDEKTQDRYHYNGADSTISSTEDEEVFVDMRPPPVPPQPTHYV